LPQAISGRDIDVLRHDLDVLVEELKSKPGTEPPDPDGYIEESYLEDEDTYLSNNPFKRSKALLQIALDTSILSLIRAYFKKNVYIQQVSLKRMFPHEADSTGSNQWHHDGWGKRIHIMVLLSDIDENDQYMSYMEGSHRQLRPYAKYENSRFTQAEVDSLCATTSLRKATGKAGDIYVFDSNGIHKGNRSVGRTRETCLVCYSPDPSYVWRLGQPRHFISELKNIDTTPIEKMARDENDPVIFPKYRSWVQSLPHPSSWL
jgi:hypothetical protein